MVTKALSAHGSLKVTSKVVIAVAVVAPAPLGYFELIVPVMVTVCLVDVSTRAES